MSITLTTRLQLKKQSRGDGAWEVPLNDGFDNADNRLLSTGAASPVGVAEGFYVGHLYYQTGTSPPTVWICTAVGTPGTWIQLSQLKFGGDVTAAIVLANAIALQGKEFGGTARALIQMLASDKIQVGVLTNLLSLLTSGVNNLKVDYGSGEKTIWHAGNLDTATLQLKAYAYDHDFGAMSGVAASHAHGLGAALREVHCYIEKTAGAAEGGWNVGDRIHSPQYSESSAGLIVGSDATNVYWARGTGNMTFVQKTGNNGFTMTTPGNWKIVVFGRL